jgi:hypothetical protein
MIRYKALHTKMNKTHRPHTTDHTPQTTHYRPHTTDHRISNKQWCDFTNKPFKSLFSPIKKGLRTIAHIISVLFHPLLIILYLLMILIALNPYVFSLSDLHEKTTFFVYTFVNTLVIPILSIFIMKMLGMVKSFEMKDNKERIGPLIVIGSLYLWMFINFKDNQMVPPLFSSFILGSVLAIFTSFFINNFTKISLHMVGMGGLIIALILIKLEMPYDKFFIDVFNSFGAMVTLDFMILVAILLAGITGTARLYLKAHQPSQIYLGFIIGGLTQLMAFSIIF